MDGYEPPSLHEFIQRVESLVITRVLDEFEKELG